MNPQGSSIINAAYFTALTNQINQVGSCAQLQALVTTMFNSINAQLAALNSQIALLGPMESLLTAPAANPTAIVTWLESFISSYLTPQLVAYTTYATQLTEMTTAIANLTSAVHTASAKFPSCTITIP